MANEQLNIVLCWHMHQPWYRQGIDGAFQLPWVYLHAIKDYSDMAAHLEKHRRMKAVVNFAPVLLEQLEDYAIQMSAFLQTGEEMQDRLLNLLVGAEPIPTDVLARRTLLVDCQRCHAPRMIHPYPAFMRLLDLSKDAQLDAEKVETLAYLSDQYFIDVLTWYHLVWLGNSLRDLPIAERLFKQQRQFTLADRRELLQVMQECIMGLIPRYKNLAARGQVELAISPYMHPIIPLLNDFKNMRDTMPDAPAPEASIYPGGVERSRWHIERGLQVFERYFGFKPRGVWLSEGAISSDALALLDEYGIAWTASGEGVWRNSCQLSGLDGEEVKNRSALFMTHQHLAQKVHVYFRDDGLSDLIGFKYSQWKAEDAVADFVHNLRNIVTFLGKDAHRYVVPVILDGENAWEYYPDNGQHFLDQLYSALTETDIIQPTTFAAISDTPEINTQLLPRVSAGSWVYGTFSTWIGESDKNRAWNYLAAAKLAYDGAKEQLSVEQLERATQQLAVCEGSDWFWWFGDYNAKDSVSDFERLYRQQLQILYQLLMLPAPSYLNYPISVGGGGVENAGTMRQNVG